MDKWAHDETVEVCDFNRKAFPSRMVDVAFASGVLEYLEDPRWFIGCLAQSARRCVVSYCTIDDFPEMRMRTKQKWQSHLRASELIECFTRHGMSLTKAEHSPHIGPILVFEKLPR